MNVHVIPDKHRSNFARVADEGPTSNLNGGPGGESPRKHDNPEPFARCGAHGIDLAEPLFRLPISRL